MTQEFQQEYLSHYRAAVENKAIKNWATDTKGFEKYLTKVGMEQSKIDDMKLRMSMHNKVGNNHEYLGNGLTKNLNTEVSNQYGAVETLNFERKEINLQQLKNANAISIIQGLKSI